MGVGKERGERVNGQKDRQTEMGHIERTWGGEGGAKQERRAYNNVLMQAAYTIYMCNCTTSTMSTYLGILSAVIG